MHHDFQHTKFSIEIGQHYTSIVVLTHRYIRTPYRLSWGWGRKETRRAEKFWGTPS